MKTRYFLILFLIVLTSCKYGVNISLENNTNDVIDSVLIESNFKPILIKEMKTDQVLEFFVDFKENNPKVDGIFTIKVHENDSVMRKQFGYYSNGIPPNNNFNIEIFNDSIQVNTN